MIDTVVFLQAVVAGLILWRACHEDQRWDKAGFAMLACSAGLMTIRRVTANLDRYVLADKVLLPTFITWVMLASAVCFTIEMIVRIRDRNANGIPQLNFVGGIRRYVWPFGLLLLVSASDFIPALSAKSNAWTGESITTLTHEDALREAQYGVNSLVGCEAVRYHAARGIDVLGLEMGSKDPVKAETAKRKIEALIRRARIYVPEPREAAPVPATAELPKQEPK